jgi:hypothetical protein
MRVSEDEEAQVPAAGLAPRHWSFTARKAGNSEMKRSHLLAHQSRQIRTFMGSAVSCKKTAGTWNRPVARP